MRNLSINEVMELHLKNDGYFFTERAMEFFNSRIESEVYENRYFITSEQQPEYKRKYTIRVIEDINDCREISTLGGFQAFDSLYLAKHCLKKEHGVEA